MKWVRRQIVNEALAMTPKHPLDQSG